MNQLHELLYHPLAKLLEQIKVEIDNPADPREEENDEILDRKIDSVESAIYMISDLQSGEASGSNTNDIVNNLSSNEVLDESSDSWCLFKKIAALTAFVEENENFDPFEQLDHIFEEFQVRKVNDLSLPFVCFSYLNTLNQEKSIAFINLGFSDQSVDLDSDPTEFQSKLYNSNLTPQFAAWLTKRLHDQEELDPTAQYIFFHPDFDNGNGGAENIISALMVQAVLQGKIIHSPKAVVKPTIDPRFSERLSPADPYQQFNELLTILSEYNENADIIRAFLSLYHVLESFMVKVPIAKLAKDNAGKIFSIRDFQRLYDSIEKNELNSIEKLFNGENGFWEREILNVRFSSTIESLRCDFIRRLDQTQENQIEEFLKKINIKALTKYEDFRSKPFTPKVYAQLIYKVRCAVVHNKETEHHISYFNLDPGVSELFNTIFINPLVHLFADLLTDKSSPIWYDGPEIKLY